MERAAFLVESTGERIECLLNPESVTLTRQAGLLPRRSLSGVFTGTADPDSPLLATGGGVTELLLDLLFDVSKQANAQPDDSVQSLTSALWNLTENSDGSRGLGSPPLVRFVWGKAWNIPAVVVSVAERFEQFTAAGIPRRSWVRMRLLRQNEPVAAAQARTGGGMAAIVPERDAIRPEMLQAHEVLGEAGDDDRPARSDRIDYLAHQHYGDSSMWRVIAAFNDLDDPANLAPGTQLLLPPVQRTS